MNNETQAELDEKHLDLLADLADDLIVCIDACAINMPKYLDNNRELYLEDIRTMFHLVRNYRTRMENIAIEARNKPLKKLEPMDCYGEPLELRVNVGTEGLIDNQPDKVAIVPLNPAEPTRYEEPADQDNFPLPACSVGYQNEQETPGSISDFPETFFDDIRNSQLGARKEADPSGLDAHEAGAKLDAGKMYADAILAEMPRALWGVIEVGTFGANKYSLGGWTSVEDGVRRYRDAAARHRLKRQMGETVDPDSGLLHEYHEAWNVLASLELGQRAREES